MIYFYCFFCDFFNKTLLSYVRHTIIFHRCQKRKMCKLLSNFSSTLRQLKLQ